MSKEHFHYVGGHSRRLHSAVSECENCRLPMRMREATVEQPYAYDLSGLKNVALVGIQVWECTRCRAEMPVIPRVADLHRVIVESLIYKPTPLAGDEIRFLRKNAGFAAQKFAALLGIDPSHLSRVETGKTRRLGRPSDLLARAVVSAESRGGEAAREILLDIAKRAQVERKNTRGRRVASQPLLFRLKGNRWAA